MMKISSKDYINELLAKGARESGRGLLDYRNIGIGLDRIPHAEGSAQVDIGNTRILAAVKITVGEPMLDKPDEGVLMTGAELLPLANPEYEMGPPTPEAIQFARVVDRGIRAANIIDTKSLFIEKDKVWCIFVDLYVLNYDGNLYDTGTLAATSALLSAKMPKYENEEVIREGNLARLKTNGVVTSCTFAKIGDKLLLDPDGSEEGAMSCNMTIANDEKVLRAMQKGLRGSLKPEELNSMVDTTFEKSKQLRDMIKKAVGE